MGAGAPLWAPVLLLLALPGQPPGAAAQSQACSVDRTFVSIEENSSITKALVNISVPDGQHVTLGPTSTASAFRILENQLFLNVTPDYEENTMLEAHLECRRGSTVVTQLVVLVSVLDVNDNAPEFPFTMKEQNVLEDTKVNSIVIPEDELKATDNDTEDVLFYTLQEVTPNAKSFFSLVSVNRPALRLDQPLDFYKWQTMTFQLLVRDTQGELEVPSHTATATLVLHVLPADLRPPWFLPCAYSDGYVCIQAQYHGAVPTEHTLLSPLILHPGPIYAVDGDRGIDVGIIYSIVGGNTDNTFVIDKDSGNLTMAKSIPSPTTFILLIRGQQTDMARYSVTQATVEARSTTGRPPYFPQSLYRGIVAPGSGAGVAVRDAASPSQPLRIQAQDPDFLVHILLCPSRNPETWGLNSAITYQITNCSEFRMDGEAVLTTTALEHEGVFYAEVEATNTVTNNAATVVAEIWVSEQGPPAIGTPGGGSTGQDGEPGGPEELRFSVVDMAVLGGVLGALLLLALIVLAVLLYKHYWHPLYGCSGKAAPCSFDNQAFLGDHEATKASIPRPEPGSTPVETRPAPLDPEPLGPTPPDPEPLAPQLPGPEFPMAARAAGDSPSAVRSILTKERRPEGGYKAVWFGEDIGAEADVVVLNTPGAGEVGDGDSEGSSEEDGVLDRDPCDALGDSTYI
ncbi:cadherin-related family member 5 isoform X5 [Fukomys damarensis]|uniref:cadherin-related family member 5 isoform X5 n=1 Tax=Fukomys damarensis TaxID=885580 RepID=UPI0008FF57EB|nr:cadherin-related family member 5 isoform X5 [Fukomys damarensis]